MRLDCGHATPSDRRMAVNDVQTATTWRFHLSPPNYEQARRSEYDRGCACIWLVLHRSAQLR